MTRLPKKRGITQAEADKSLILRQNKPTPRSSVEKFPGENSDLVILVHDYKFQFKKALAHHLLNNHSWNIAISSLRFKRVNPQTKGD